MPAQQYMAYRLGASELYLVAYASVFLAIMLLVPRGILPSIQDRIQARRAHVSDRESDASDVGRQTGELVA